MPQRRKEIFISYAREDGSKAESIKVLLLNNGYKVWMDIDNGLTGEVFLDVIRDKLNQVDFVVLIISKESIKPNRVVADEFDIALKIQQAFTDKRIYLLPLKIDDCIYPKQFQPYSWTEYTDAGRKKLLHTIYTNPGRIADEKTTDKPFPKTDKYKLLKIWSAAVLLVLALIIGYYFLFAKRAIHFKGTLTTLESNTRIAGVVAYILNQEKDTILKSMPSGSDGVVEFSLDTFPGIQYIIRYTHPAYYDTSAKNKLEAGTTERYIKMRSKTTSAIPAKPVSTKSTYRITSFQLTTAEQQTVMMQTGYAFNAGSSARYQFEYDHTAFMQINGNDQYTFAGSRIWLTGNESRVYTGIDLPAVSSPPFPKAQLELFLQDKMNELIGNNRTQIVKTLIKCLQNS